MQVVVERCAALDVAKAEVVACVRVPDGHGGRDQQVRTLLTFTSGLEALADWLDGEGVTESVRDAPCAGRPVGRGWKVVVGALILIGWAVLGLCAFVVLNDSAG